MKTILMGLMGLVITGCVSDSPAVNQIVRKTSPVVRIESKDGALTSAGTACLVRHNHRHYVLTAYHTLSKPGIITIYDEGRRALPVVLDKPIRLGQTDCAAIPVRSHLIQTDWFEIPPSRMSSEKCMAQGYPRDGDLHVSNGTILTLKLQTGTDAIVGMSGGPVLSGNNLIGIISSMCIAEDGNKTAFATGIEIIAHYLERL